MRALRIGDIRVAFTDRHSKVSLPPHEVARLGAEARAVAVRGRDEVASALGLPPGRVVYLRQVHGAEVAYVREPFADSPPPVDGVCTDQARLALAILVADCAPVLLADPVAGVVGAAHAGRAGTTAGVVDALVAALVARGGVPSRMTSVIGPAACALCYEVSAEIREEMAAVIPESWATTRWGTPGLDLRGAITALLHRSGVQDVRHEDRCTIEAPELYSYRREGPTGDFAAYIWREEPNSLISSRKAV
ncbi:peptidoglycan editing factor PgeF [Nonomuraea sp. NPDC050691]|uniref:peptidoglycan editing factor PgeF n=1 Tax=Nonomuraea sp. NPDC050691 TaxID=3155661 RepID=UPI0033F68B65